MIRQVAGCRQVCRQVSAAASCIPVYGMVYVIGVVVVLSSCTSSCSNDDDEDDDGESINIRVEEVEACLISTADHQPLPCHHTTSPHYLPG